jgi:hypothetical protein
MVGGNFPQRDNSRNPQDGVKGQGSEARGSCP